MTKAFFKVSDLTELLSLGRSKIYEMLASGELPSVRLGNTRTVRVPAAALQKWIDEQSAKATQQAS
jgi:excisionase family DNA binding protein